jgi:hypothetical protein
MIRKQRIKNSYRRLRAEFGVKRRTLHHTNAFGPANSVAIYEPTQDARVTVALLA